MKVRFINPHNGSTKDVKVGWSWMLFLFSSFFGLPLFVRGLYGWGIAFLFISICQVVILFTARNPGAAGSSVSFAMLVISVVLAARGNEFTGKSLLKKGWKFYNPDSPEVARAKLKWRLA